MKFRHGWDTNTAGGANSGLYTGLGRVAAATTKTEMQGTDLSQLRAPARVLTVLAQPVLAEVVRLALSHGQFQTRIATDEAEAMLILGEWHPHLALIDMDVGKGELLDHLTSAPTTVGRIPVIALTRRGDLRTKLAAFDRGVDDILVVPFSPEELVARTLAIMRRTYREAIAFTPIIKLGELEVDILHRRVRAGSTELHLTSLEQSLLYLLAANAGRLVTREQILDNLWGVDYAAESNVVDRHVRNLRIKLQDDWRRPRFIATVPGRGYRFLPSLAPATA
jgi:DNA-binding response OmpR family regulator